MTCVTDSCWQGRLPCPTPDVCSDAPARTRRVQESDLRWADGIGFESANPSLVQPPRAAVVPQLEGPYDGTQRTLFMTARRKKLIRLPYFSGQAWVLIFANVAAWTLVWVLSNRPVSG